MRTQVQELPSMVRIGFNIIWDQPVGERREQVPSDGTALDYKACFRSIVRVRLPFGVWIILAQIT